jgi:hypothetical protein
VIQDPRLDRVILAHGGLESWRDIQQVQVRIDSLGGPLPSLKGMGRTFAPPTVAVVKPSEWRVEFENYPAKGQTAIFDTDSVRLCARERT